MAARRPALAALALAALAPRCLSVPPLGWPTGSVRHRFFDTARGQLHYILGGDVTASVPLVFLHSHPRSTVEFKYLVQGLNASSAFLAVDWFGMGLSEDYNGGGAEDKFCTFEEMAGYILKILARERVSGFVPVGSLKGSHPAIELAYQGGPSRVRKLVLLNPLILSPAAKAFIDNKLVPMLQRQALAVDGAHLIAAWNDTSAAPMGPAGAPWNNSRDLLANQEKTGDELRCLSTGWQYDAAWTAYNEKNEPRMAAVDAYAPSLFLYGAGVLAAETKFGLDPQFSFDAFARALTHGHNRTHVIEGGTEGMLTQNSSLIAGLIARFVGLHEPLGAIVV